MAGFQVMELVEEPVAVALAYGFGQGKNEIVAVYDFGGGTFDFTILDISVDSERVLASKGDAWLGGDDFDLVMAQAVANKFWRDTQIELQNSAVEWQRLLHACESAKQHLSRFEEIRLQLREVVSTPEPIDLVQNMRRPGFELIAASLFEQTLEICQAALDSIGFEPRDITQLVVSGGTSRIPFIHDGLSRFFERPITELVHPQQAVALGAGVAAARLAGHGARMARSV
jgi:molecular chaperone DnaK